MNKGILAPGKHVKAAKNTMAAGPTKHIETVKIKQLATHELSVVSAKPFKLKKHGSVSSH